jgi:nicotinamidase-related amidase
MAHALIVVDVQNGFVNRRSEHVVHHVVEATKLAADADLSIYFTRFINDPGSPWEQFIHWERLRSAPEIDLHSEILPLTPLGTVVDKRSYSSVVGEVRAAIEARRFETVAVCGIATDGCVLKTAVDLFEAGVRPIILTDAVASHAGEEVHEAGLLLARRFIGREQVLTIDEWRDQLQI